MAPGTPTTGRSGVRGPPAGCPAEGAGRRDHARQPPWMTSRPTTSRPCTIRATCRRSRARRSAPHRPGPGPVSDPHKRCGRGQPVGHWGLDHLPVRHQRARPAGTLINDPGQIQPMGEFGNDRQSARTLLHHGGHRYVKTLSLRPRPGRLRRTPPNATTPAQDSPDRSHHTNQRPAKSGFRSWCCGRDSRDPQDTSPVPGRPPSDSKRTTAEPRPLLNSGTAHGVRRRRRPARAILAGARCAAPPHAPGGVMSR